MTKTCWKTTVALALTVVLLIGCAGTPKRPELQPTIEHVAAPLGPGDWKQGILYFVILDRFADGDPSNNIAADTRAKGTFHGGDLRGLREQLGEIAELGITAIWITPVVKNIEGFVTGAGFPDWAYHGYWADDFTAIDPRFGTEEELRALVEDCHQRGIRVLLDVVYNHAGYNSSYIRKPQTKHWFRTEDAGTCGLDDLTSCVAGLPDFKTELPEVADYLYAAHLNLAKRTGLDGFRLDTVKHVDHQFWKEHRTRTRSLLFNHFFLLGEVWGGDAAVLDPWFSRDEMDAGFDFSFQGSVISFLLGRGRTVAFDRYLKSREQVRSGYILSHFLSSHDVPGALFQLQGDKNLFRLAAVLQFTSPGLPMIYYGEEVGRLGGDWPDNRSDMPWGDRDIKPGAGLTRDEELRSFYRKLIAIRRQHPALSRGIHTNLALEGDLLVFQEKDMQSGDTVIVGVNRGSAVASARFAPPQEWADSAIVEALSSRTIIPQNGFVEMDFVGREAKIFVASKE